MGELLAGKTQNESKQLIDFRTRKIVTRAINIDFSRLDLMEVQTVHPLETLEPYPL